MDFLYNICKISVYLIYSEEVLIEKIWYKTIGIKKLKDEYVIINKFYNGKSFSQKLVGINYCPWQWNIASRTNWVTKYRKIVLSIIWCDLIDFPKQFKHALNLIWTWIELDPYTWTIQTWLLHVITYATTTKIRR